MLALVALGEVAQLSLNTLSDGDPSVSMADRAARVEQLASVEGEGGGPMRSLSACREQLRRAAQEVQRARARRPLLESLSSMASNRLGSRPDEQVAWLANCRSTDAMLTEALRDVDNLRNEARETLQLMLAYSRGQLEGPAGDGRPKAIEGGSSHTRLLEGGASHARLLEA
jgi:hypothetical protein